MAAFRIHFSQPFGASFAFGSSDAGRRRRSVRTVCAGSRITLPAMLSEPGRCRVQCPPAAGPAFAANGGFDSHTNRITDRKMMPSMWKISLKPICAA